MIGWMIFLGYVLAWLASSSYATRWIADNYGRCNGRGVDGKRHLMDGSRAYGRGTCIEWHGEGCFRADGDITAQRFAAGAALSIAWPVLIPLLASWTFATRKPTTIGLQREIKRLEREAGIQ